ncbi:hypothetical protein [uncultured Prevotella sp.]|uniref:hypothetical protein n=1 Tax=uncultured Prevotella sp. TaxID=159272 RepID=UPI00262B53BE|nr:hypothetical protein [uncultured Prevotella sp.]
MKKFFVLTFIALFATVVSYAQENVFIINGKKIENFDGSQLTGKKIMSFNVIKNDKGDVYTIHTDEILPDSLRNRPYKVSTELLYITKDTLANGNNINKSEKPGKMEVEVTNFDMDMLNSKPLIVLDGKEYTGSLNYIKPGDINSINVYKSGSDVANAYGEKGKNGVLKIFTKASKDNVQYVVDGKPATSQEVKDIAPSKISNIVVLKRGSKAAMDYGEVGKTHDICIVKTK